MKTALIMMTLTLNNVFLSPLLGFDYYTRIAKI